MHFAKHYLIGLLAIHLLWAFFYSLGFMVRRKSEETGAFSMVDVVVSSATGMAIMGFVLLLLGFMHLLRPVPVIVTVLMGIALLHLPGKRGVFSSGFWRNAWGCFLKAWDVPSVFLWAILALLAMPALLPPVGSDVVRYHLPYAVEWARAGRIYVDPFLRFPYYANNFLLLYACLFVLKLGKFCELLCWLCGLLACLGAQAAIANFASVFPVPSKWNKIGHPEQYLVPLAIVFCPYYLRYLDTGYIDVPIGLFVLVPILCAGCSLLGSRTYEREFVITAAFCMGMKTTLIVCLPLFLFLLVLLARRRFEFRKIALTCLAMVALSLPWYVRNVLQCGDPIPPLLSVCFGRPDVIFSKADVFNLVHEPSTNKNLLHLAVFPFSLINDPESKDFREWGIDIATLLIYTPFPVLIGFFCFGRLRKDHAGLFCLTMAIVYLELFWLLSSTLGRYSIHWFPSYVGWLGAVLLLLRGRLAARAGGAFARYAFCFAAIVVSGALAMPLRGLGGDRLSRFYSELWTSTISAFTVYTNDPIYLMTSLPSYSATGALIDTFKSNGMPGGRVLDIGVETQYYMIKENLDVVGDSFGPARFGDLYKEVEEGDCAAYLNRLHIVAIITAPSLVNSTTFKPFERQLLRNHFIEYRFLPDPTPVFLSSKLKPSRQLTAVKSRPEDVPGD